MTSQATMTRKQRFFAAVAGQPVDRIPCTGWVHYMTETLGGTEHAMRHIQWIRECDWDICKVVNDFHYPFPEGVESIESVEDMLKFKPASLDEASFAEELKAIRLLRAEFGPDMPIVLTVFDPLRQVVRKAGMSTMEVIFQNPGPAKAMLDAVADTMCRYVKAAKEAGCDGIFLASNSGLRPPARFGLDDERFDKFIRPYELQMLEAMKGMVRIVHVHGAHIDMGRALDYPCEVFSVSDRLPGNPSLADLRKLTDKCLMGGIDESRIHDMTTKELSSQIRNAVELAGRDKLILAPGCTLPAWVPAHQLRRIREVSHQL
ncbi:MAG TPA: uroporphyrinogen decarboxylase family protein [Ramlibacter sp.]|nr:uroporphyrinogen decarboxylase family protein [Ramlibacter sp.]